MSEFDRADHDTLTGDPVDGDTDPVDLRDASWAGDAIDADDTERELTSTVALFEGDEGGLEIDQRKALVVLLKQRFISARTHPKEWRALTRNPRPIRARLNDLFLELYLDADREVAYKRQVAPEGGGRPFPTLLYDAPWGREDTILLVYLRSRFRSEQAAGADRVFVDRDDMLEFVDQHRPAHATDQSGDRKRAERAIEALYKAGLLIGPSTAERFEVSNAIEVLLPMEKLAELLTWLREQNSTPGGQPEAPTDPDGVLDVADDES
ncbi:MULTISPECIES: DUF4194 domain-containing protein [unclassified Modestobacter]